MPVCFDNSGNFTPCPTGGTAPVDFTSSLTQQVQGPGIGPAAGQCPMAPDGTCTDVYGNPGQSCLLIRECDPYTGAQHVQYQLPGGSVPNANIFQVQPDGSLAYLNAMGIKTNPPNYATPPYLDQGVFTSQFNPTVQAKLSAVSTVGMQYDPSAGWVPAANQAPVETSPSVAAFQTKATVPVAASSNQTSTPTNTNPSVAKYAVTGVAGAPGTSGTKSPAVTQPKSHLWLLLAAGIAIILLSRG
jgi:hypothetical protein